jgi:hypothetical protein
MTNVPEPDLVMLPVPPLMSPENVVDALLPPVVRFTPPTATTPPPASEPTAWLKLPRSSVAPAATVTAEEEPMALLTLSVMTPPLTAVAPV